MKKLYVRPQPIGGDVRRLGEMEGTTQYSEKIGGFDRIWKEYIPTSYDGSKPVPMVVEVHGGSTHNSTYMRPMAYLAEREGFIVLFPLSIINGVTWNVFGDLSEKDGMPDDVAYFDYIIAKMREKYNIDPERIYIHGQSMGDLMVTTYLRERSYLFAAAAPFSGPAGPLHHLNADGSMIYPVAKVPVVRTQGSEDLSGPVGRFQPPDFDAVRKAPEAKPTIPAKIPNITDEMRQSKVEVHQLINMKSWIEKNECEKLPRLTLIGKYGVLVWPGEPYDFTFMCVEGGQHNPRHEMYDYLWQYFFTGFKRVNGEVVRVEPKKKFVEDVGAVVLAIGADKAYVNNVLTDIGAPAKDVDGFVYVPLKFLEKAYPGMTTEVFHDGEDGKSAYIHYDGHELQISTGSRTCLLDQYFKDMEIVQCFDGEIYVSIADVARLFFGKVCSSGRGIFYISDNLGDISYNFAYFIEVLLGKRRLIGTDEMLALENERIAKIKK